MRISESKALRPERSAARTASRLLSPPLTVGDDVPLNDGFGVTAEVGDFVTGVCSEVVGVEVAGGNVVGCGVADPQRHMFGGQFPWAQFVVHQALISESPCQGPIAMQPLPMVSLPPSEVGGVVVVAAAVGEAVTVAVGEDVVGFALSLSPSQEQCVTGQFEGQFVWHHASMFACPFQAPAALQEAASILSSRLLIRMRNTTIP